MRLLEQQGWHNHCSFQGYALQGRCVGICSEHACCLEYKCLPCFTRGDLEQVTSPVYNFFIAQVDGVDDIFAVFVAPLKTRTLGWCEGWEKSVSGLVDYIVGMGFQARRVVVKGLR